MYFITKNYLIVKTVLKYETSPNPTVPLYLSDNFGGNGDLSIVRAIVPGMVPMTFGYRQEPAGMERIYKVAEEFENRELSYRKLTKFPHPFA